MENSSEACERGEGAWVDLFSGFSEDFGLGYRDSSEIVLESLDISLEILDSNAYSGITFGLVSKVSRTRLEFICFKENVVVSQHSMPKSGLYPGSITEISSNIDSLLRLRIMFSASGEVGIFPRGALGLLITLETFRWSTLISPSTCDF